MTAENKSIVVVDESKAEKKMFRSRKFGSMKRKATIFKKTMELSKLCDVEACTVVVDTDGEVSTWPENWNEVLKTVKNYRDGRCRRDNEKKQKKETPPLLKELDEDEKLFAGISMEDVHRFLKDDNGTGGNEPRNLVEEVELKISSLTERIEFLKYEKEDNQKNPSSCCRLLKSVPKQMVPIPCFFASNPQCTEMVPSSCFFDSNPLYFHGMSDPAASGFYGMNNLPGTAAPTSGSNEYNQEESISEIATTNPISLGGGVTQQFNSANFLDFDFLNFDHFY